MKDKIIPLLYSENIEELSRELSSVKKLDLAKCNITDVQAKVLAETLKSNKSISKVLLNNNNIGKDGIEYLVQMMEQNHTIIILNLFNNKHTDASQKSKIKELLKRNYTEKEVAKALKRQAEEDEKTELQDELTKQLEQAEQDKEALENQLKETQEKAAQDKAKSEEDISALKIETEKKEADFKTKQDELTKQINILTVNNETLEEAKTNLQRILEEKVADAAKAVGDLTQQKDRVDVELADLKSMLSDSKTDNRQLTDNYNILQITLEKLQDEFHKAKTLYNETLENLKNKANTEIQKKEDEITGLQAKVSSVVEQGEKNLEQFKNYKQHLKDQSKALEQKEAELTTELRKLKGDQAGQYLPILEETQPLLPDDHTNEEPVNTMGNPFGGCDIL